MNHTDITPHIIPRRQWLVAYVQSCLEKKTAERLKAMGVEYYLPIQSEIRQWSDRRKKVDRLVIPMMIFVHVTPQERPLPLTLQAISRYMVLRGESRPAVIPEEQMERFRFMLDYSPEAVEICSTPLAAGDAVKVRPPCRIGGRTGHDRRKKQSGSPAGYAGLRTCGHADRIRGEN